MTYRPELDGLRGVAALVVVLFHCRVPGFGGGFLGVDVFFVLSGFLITSILLAEHAGTGGIALGRFYWRRALRLYPALLLMLAVYLSVAPLLWPGHPHGTEALLAGLYLADYSIPLSDYPDYLKHTWSLAVEEQFYLLYPLALILCLRRMSPAELAKWLVIAVAVAVAWRLLNRLAVLPTYHRFDTRLGGLLAGGALAAFQASVPIAVDKRWVAVAGTALLGYAMVAAFIAHVDSILFLVPTVELATLAILYGASTLKTLSDPGLVWLGRLSYGIYLWHYPIARAVRDDYPWWVTFPLVLALSTAAAFASWHTVEAAARKLRNRHGALIGGPIL